MVTRRLCAFRNPDGKICHSPPLHDSHFCLMHSPEHAQEVQEARRLGGLRRKREATISGAYDFEGLDTIDGILRLLQLVAIDTLGMENSISRNRTLIYLAMVNLKALEVGVHEERINALEQAVQAKRIETGLSVFEAEPDLLESAEKETK